MHIVQSPVWEEFKQSFGTPTARVGDIFYTKHAIPFTGKFYAYCPKVDPFSLDFSSLQASLIAENCIAINFDVPKVLTESPFAEEAKEVFNSAGCVVAPKSTFTQYNLLLDLRPSEEELLANMHPKHRYNIRYAKRKGVTVREAQNPEDFEVFYNLALETARRQAFFIHPKEYYRKIWDILGTEGAAKILTAYYKDEPLASWMFFIYDSILYYPYGGSSEKHLNLHASNLLCWEGMLLGKSQGCEVFDMWGSNKEPQDKSDPHWGFTNFKMKFGARHVESISSYDYVINPMLYRLFNTANKIRWLVLNSVRGSA